MLPEPVYKAINWGTCVRESGSFIDSELADSQSDLLFSVQLAEDRVLLYLLLEHQSTVAQLMPLRLAHYIVRIWKRYVKERGLPLPVILPGLVTHAPGGWTGATTLSELIVPTPSSIQGLAPLVLDHSMLVLDLAGLDDAKLRGWAFDAFSTLALVMLRDGRDSERLRADFARWRDVFLEVLSAPNGADAVAQVLRYIAVVTGDMHFQDFRATIASQLPEAEEITMTVAQELRQEGRQEGRQVERAEMLVKLLTLKFGNMSPAALTQIEAAAFEQLGRYLERVLTADSLESVLAD